MRARPPLSRARPEKARPAEADGGSLTVVGTGYIAAGHITPEALAHIDAADKFFYLGGDPATRMWLESRNPTCESLYDAYRVGGDRRRTYDEMTRRMLEPVRVGHNVCAAFYGHPGVFVGPTHAAIDQARAEGYRAVMLPAVSAEDCLYADLGVDPAEHGCQSWEATMFVLQSPRYDPRSALILWQIGAVGVMTYEDKALWSEGGLRLLVATLLDTYPPEHEVVVYQASIFPVCEPSIQRVQLADLLAARVTTQSTLYVPPREPAALDPILLERLGIELKSGATAKPIRASGRAPAPTAHGDGGKNGGQQGTLTVVGTGYNVAGQITTEAKAHLEYADRVLYLLSDPITSAYVRGLNPSTTSLHDSYWDGRCGAEACEEMVDRILAPVREGLRVCAAFYGHPAVFVPPSHEAIGRARAEGHEARMLPGISVADCLFAELGLDPGANGCQLFEATDFLLTHRRVDLAVPLILLQVGVVGTIECHSRRVGDAEGFRLLVNRLLELYPEDHLVTLYEKSQIPTLESRIDTRCLNRIGDARLTVYSSLVVPPAEAPRLSEDMARRMGIESLLTPTASP